METLRDVVQVLDELEDEGTIYTDGRSPAARAAVVTDPSDGAAKAAGLRYFLEVSLAKEAVARLERMARISAADHRRQAHGDLVLRDARRLPAARLRTERRSRNAWTVDLHRNQSPQAWAT